VLFQLLGRPGQVTFASAMAMAVLLAGLTAIIILSVDRLRAGTTGSF